MPAKNGAAGGGEPRRYEIRARGPLGPTMMKAFPTLAANGSGRRGHRAAAEIVNPMRRRSENRPKKG
jgi:hypothetical protein